MEAGHWLFKDGGMHEICEAYRIGDWTGDWGKLGGSFNDNLSVTTDRGRYVIRISGEASHLHTERLQELYRLAKQLHGRQIPVPVPLEAADGSPYLKMNGKFIQLFPYLEGRVFSGGEAQVSASAAMLRHFHAALETETCRLLPVVSFYRSREDCLATLADLGEIARISRYGLAEAVEVCEMIYECWSAAEPCLPVTILHGDWHLWNQLYSSDQVEAVLDLDYMQQGPRILDIAYAMWMIHILLPAHADGYRVAFLTGYGALTPQEIEILPVATARIAVSFLCHAADSSRPAHKWNRQYAAQMPFIRWLLSAGGEQLRAACLSLGGSSGNRSLP